jgi:LAS seventeen-binding protein 1/2
VAQQAQDPNNAAHPQNPNVCDVFPFYGFAREASCITNLVLDAKHHQWAMDLATKFGNAAMFGAGATFGGDMVNDALHAL